MKKTRVTATDSGSATGAGGHGGSESGAPSEDRARRAESAAPVSCCQLLVASFLSELMVSGSGTIAGNRTDKRQESSRAESESCAQSPIEKECGA